MAAAFALCSAFAIGYNTADSYQYLLPAAVLAVFCSGVGLHRLAAELARRGGLAGPFARPLVWLAVASVLALGAVGYRTQDLSSNHTPLDFARATLVEAPEDAVLISQQDAHTFALWYYQQAEAIRPDVVVIDTGLLGEEWYNRQAEARLELLPGNTALAALRAIGDGTAVARPIVGRPVCIIEAQTPAGPFELRCAAS